MPFALLCSQSIKTLLFPMLSVEKPVFNLDFVLRISSCSSIAVRYPFTVEEIKFDVLHVWDKAHTAPVTPVLGLKDYFTSPSSWLVFTLPQLY